MVNAPGQKAAAKLVCNHRAHLGPAPAWFRLLESAQVVEIVRHATLEVQEVLRTPSAENASAANAVNGVGWDNHN